MESVLIVHQDLAIPMAELRFEFVRSSGPGGQNVNKRATKAVLTWDLVHSPTLPADHRRRFLARFGNRVDREGVLRMTSQRHRDRERNVADLCARLRTLLLETAFPEPPRHKTRPTRASVRRRLDGKRQRGERKRERRRPAED
ncbi:MAG: alternative ribosome rescue aminoacyl-tRNA hydrolase ArfB [Planctomycetota bacterium]